MSKSTRNKSGKAPFSIQRLLLATFAILFVIYVIQDYQLTRKEQAGASSVASTPGASSAENPTDNPAAELRVYFLDVGQADSIFIRLPDDRTMLIDAGNNNDGAPVSAYLKQLGVQKLDFVVGTHPHEDHIGGLDVVIQAFDVGEVLLPVIPDKQVPTTRTYSDLLDTIMAKNLSVTAAHTGMVLFENAALGLKAEILSPKADAVYGGLNDYSVVIRLTYGSRSFLFTGDAESQPESELLADGSAVQADVLKVGHHGSSSSTTQAFLNAVAPSTAIISCGKKNDYGHPHRETLQKLTQAGVELYRTDEQQTILAVCNGKTISFETGLPSCNGAA